MKERKSPRHSEHSWSIVRVKHPITFELRFGEELICGAIGIIIISKQTHDSIKIEPIGIAQ